MAIGLIPVLEKDEVKKLLNAPSKRYPTGIRNKAMIQLMLQCGLRVSEVVGHEKRYSGGLRIQDIDFNSGKLTIRDAKDTRRVKSKNVKAGRIVYANEETLNSLRNWWEIRSTIDTDKDHFFTTLQGNNIHPTYIRKMVKRYGVKVGLKPDQIYPHLLRHTFGTLFYQKTLDLRLTQITMGHSSSKTTEIYCHLSGAQVQDAMRAFCI